jgi:NAD(P)-dependent dehydrogenase (short-subunit alcohol dehydrogenase family)
MAIDFGLPAGDDHQYSSCRPGSATTAGPYDAGVPRRGWTEADVPSQQGRVFVVTGANAGLGFETARCLAARGGRVVLACRRPEAGGEAADRIRSRVPGAALEVEPLDLAELASVEAFAGRVNHRLGQLHCLINNAGIMGVPRSVTVDGFERQLAVNHLGHFALTGRLLPLLLAAPRPRVVTVTSETYRWGHLDLADLQGERRYRRWHAYAQSKLANLLFSLELDRRSRAAGLPLLSAAAHPGYAATGLQLSPERRLPGALQRFWAWANAHAAQDAAGGALPTLRAATDAAAAGGALYGPSGLLRGPAVPGKVSARVADPEAASRLWEASEALTGVRFSF